MSRLEDELKNALRREDVPEGFAERVLARVARQNRPAPAFHWRDVFARPRLRWAAAWALSAILVIGGFRYRQMQLEKIRRAQGEAAKQQLMLALRIASSKLQLAKARVNDLSVKPNRSVKE